MSQKVSLTTQITNLKNDIDQLSKVPSLKLDANKFKPVNAIIESKTMGYEELENELATIGKVTGWVLATSRVYTFNNDDIELDTILLNGEWISSANTNTSYLVEYIGNHQWTLQTCKLNFNCSESAGFNYLAEEITQLEKDSNRKLIYQRLWQLQGGPTATMAFFIGFDIPDLETKHQNKKSKSLV